MTNKNTYTEIFENKIAEKLRVMILPYKDILSRDIHIECGGYPGPNHHMQQCYTAMYNMMAGDDEVLSAHQAEKAHMLKQGIIKGIIDNIKSSWFLAEKVGFELNCLLRQTHFELLDTLFR